MKDLLRILGIAAFWASAACMANAETGALELKRLDPRGSNVNDYMYRATMPQHCFVQLMPKAKEMPEMGDQRQTQTFKRLVKKEPKYQSSRPFRGVVKIGSQEFIFALDATQQPKPAEKKEAKEKPAAEKKADEKDGKKALPPPTKKPAEEVSPETSALMTAISYDRLYFDFNHNGDLTDDKVLESLNPESRGRNRFGNQCYLHFEFPRLDVALESDGVKLESSLFPSGQTMASPDFGYVAVSFNAGAYREGDITIGGKKRHLVLIDFNSNGRFDDQTKIRSDVHTPDNRIFPEQGDMLLIDPDPKKANAGSPYDVAASDGRHFVSKIINIGGAYYDLKVSPTGDQVTLTPSAVPLGNITNPNDGFSAVIYGEQGFLKVHGNKNVPIPVPVGEWKLLSYSINRTNIENPIDVQKKKEAAEKKNAKTDKKTEDALAKLMTKAVESMFGSPTGSSGGTSIVSASATTKYKAIKVSKGETILMPFGPPYKPVVQQEYYENNGKDKQLSLELSLVGSTGEVVTDLMTHGRRPSKPDFTITDSKQKVVAQGNFEYG
jgi:hypothetical protein